MNTANQKLDIWAIVELFGHAKIAGKVSEQNIAGTNMLRVDVPETKENPPFTRFFGAAAIYAINPVSEEVAVHYADRLHVQPIQTYEVDKLIEQKMVLLKHGSNHQFDTEDLDDDLPI